MYVLYCITVITFVLNYFIIINFKFFFNFDIIINTTCTCIFLTWTCTYIHVHVHVYICPPCYMYNHVVITFYLYMYPLPIVDPLMFPPLDQPSKEVDEKANAYFQAIYNGRMAVDHLLEILKQFKDSQTKKEKVIALEHVTMGTGNLSIVDNVTFGCQKVSLIALSINNFIEYFCFVYF